VKSAKWRICTLGGEGKRKSSLNNKLSMQRAAGTTGTGRIAGKHDGTEGEEKDSLTRKLYADDDGRDMRTMVEN